MSDQWKNCTDGFNELMCRWVNKLMDGFMDEHMNGWANW